jgi:hypothetical protein
MTRYLITAIVMACLITACVTASRNSSAVDPLMIQQEIPIDPDSLLTGQQPLSIFDLPRSQYGDVVLAEGFYEGEFKSYCLQPGTPAPSGRDAYMQAPLNAHRRDIVESILRNSIDRPDLDQKNVQLLLWSVVSGSDYNKLSPSVKYTSRELLTQKQVFALQGGVLNVVRTVANYIPDNGLSPVLNDMRNLFEIGNSSYEAYEQIAVLRQPSTVHRPNYKKEQWYKQDGYYVRYMPSSYQRTRIQVYVPKGSLDTDGKRSGSYVTFDPVTMMAIPANSNAQRLGIGAPVADVVRRVMQISKPTPGKPQNNNPKQIVLN